MPFDRLKLFGDLVKNHETICEGTSDGACTAFAVKGADGRKSLLVVDYGGKDQDISIAVKGVPADAKPVCTVLDDTHDLAEQPVSFKDGTLAIRKNDVHSATFLVEFKK